MITKNRFERPKRTKHHNIHNDILLFSLSHALDKKAAMNLVDEQMFCVKHHSGGLEGRFICNVGGSFA
ncbi:MAG: hypothetical protein CW716_00055 [Candidatus Bathyarchaeum sp.]|nr:MAG: hypothetical protein CW716_00055 [Candidatus Bathyarchaeum sp.]